MFHFEQLTAGWRCLSPFAKLRCFMNFIYFWGRVAQLEVITKRPNGPVILSCLFICIFSSALIVYTSVFYIMIGELSKAVPSYCMTGIMASTHTASWSVVLKDRMKWVPLLDMAIQKIYRDDRRPTAYTRICSECMDNTLKTYIITITVIMCSFAVALTGPIYTYLQDGSVVTLYEVRIPFLLDYPEKEFMINLIWQVYISFVGVAGLFLIEGVFAIINNTITVTSKLIVQEFMELSDELEVGNISGEESGQRLIKIFVKIIYMDGYISSFRDLSFWRLLLSPPTFTIAIAISIYSQYVNKRILEALYQCKWYLLPAKYQKDLIYMIQHLQNKEGLTIGPFGPLNYETLKFLTQKIYSFLMFLININS